MDTVDELIGIYANKLAKVYNEQTVGDHTFAGILTEFARKLLEENKKDN